MSKVNRKPFSASSAAKKPRFRWSFVSLL